MSTSILSHSDVSAKPPLARLQEFFPEAGVRMVISSTAECLAAWAVPRTRAADEGESGKESALRHSQIIHVFAPFPDAAAHERFEDVVGKLRTIDAPGIVPLLEAGVRENHPYMIFRCPSGMTVRQALAANEGKLDPENALKWASEVAVAVGHLHEAGLYHGGIHPNNIVISEDGQVWLLAPAVEMVFERPPERRAKRYLNFTPDQRAHLAPEQGDPYRRPDRQSDFNAIGSLLFTTLTGSHPSVMFKLVSKECDLDQSIDEVITSCLQNDPAQRPLSASTLAQNIAKVNPGYRPRAVTMTKADDFELEVFPNQVKDGSAFPKWIIPVLVVCLAISGGVWAYIVKKNKPVPEASGTSEAEAKMPMTADEIRAAIARHQFNLEEIKKVVAYCVRHGQQKLVAQLLEEHISRMPPDTNGLNATKQYLKEFLGHIAAFDAAIERAAVALAKKDNKTEHEELILALTHLPEEPTGLGLLSENPLEIEVLLRKAVNKIRAGLGHDSEHFHASYHVARGSVRLDLSSNPKLTNIAPLAGIDIHELDLSNTSIAKLSALKGMSLRRIWLDDTKVENLEILDGMPIETLTFERSNVQSVKILSLLKQLRISRYLSRSDEMPVVALATPDSATPWENSLGIRFAPVREHPGVLVSTSKVRVQDFREFVEDSSYEMPVATFVPDATETAGTEEKITWDHPSLAPGPRYPVVGISYKDATAFCAWLTERDRIQGHIPRSASYRLPFDSEWSAAAGIIEHADQQPAARELEGLPHDVKISTTKKVPASHALGVAPFRGLLANVREWTATPYDATSSARSVRGSVMPEHLSTFNVNLRARSPEDADAHRADVGFRIVLSLDAPREFEPLVQSLEQGNDEEAFVLSRLIQSQAALENLNIRRRQIAEMADSILILQSIIQSNKKGVGIDNKIKPYIVEHKTSRYLSIHVPVNWPTANRLAQAAGGHLIYIGQNSELDALKTMLLPKDNARTPNAFWLGATVRTATSKPAWTWPGNQSPLPSFVDPRNRDDRLLLAPEPRGDAGPQMGWRARHQSHRHRFVIEWD